MINQLFTNVFSYQLSIRIKNGFTLVELLVVIGILAVLAVTLLIALNPGEAQRRSRDIQRLRDIAVLQSAIDQYIQDGGNTNRFGSGTLMKSNEAISNQAQACDANWLNADLCSYIQTVPVDPINTSERPCANDVTCTMSYGFMYRNGEYELNVPLEARSNSQKVNEYGYYEVGVGGTQLIGDW